VIQFQANSGIHPIGSMACHYFPQVIHL
jgi:hypothetical protein